MKTRSTIPIDEIALPVLEARGARDGPTLVVSAGVHGDEYEGVRAIYEIFEELDTSRLAGRLLAAPVVNPPAHRACTRVSPVDQANLARVFPGDPAGTLSERVAWHFANKILAQGDFYLDLHSGGVRYRMPSMAGYYAGDPRGLAAAEIFGAPVIWGHPVIEPGRTVSFARDRGIPFLYTEARGAGRIHREDLAMMKRGIRNLLAHLGISGEAVEPGPAPVRLTGAGNTDVGIGSTQAGFLMKEVEVMDEVREGQRLGYLVDLTGAVVEEYRSPQDGVIGLTREMPAVDAGDTLFLLAQRA